MAVFVATTADPGGPVSGPMSFRYAATACSVVLLLLKRAKASQIGKTRNIGSRVLVMRKFLIRYSLGLGIVRYSVVSSLGQAMPG
jgi:hypothetical protein